MRALLRATTVVIIIISVVVVAVVVVSFVLVPLDNRLVSIAHRAYASLMSVDNSWKSIPKA